MGDNLFRSGWLVHQGTKLIVDKQTKCCTFVQVKHRRSHCKINEYGKGESCGRSGRI